MRQVGKVGKRRAKGMKTAAPIVCARAGGWWAGTEGCIDARCEICERGGWWPLAHIDERSQQGNEDPENLLNACPDCHDHVKYGDGGLSCGTERAKEIARREK